MEHLFTPGCQPCQVFCRESGSTGTAWLPYTSTLPRHDSPRTTLRGPAVAPTGDVIRRKNGLCPGLLSSDDACQPPVHLGFGLSNDAWRRRRWEVLGAWTGSSYCFLYTRGMCPTMDRRQCYHCAWFFESFSTSPSRSNKIGQPHGILEHLHSRQASKA